MADKNILLVEPGYKNKYPPLGLMKIAQYHGPRGKRDHVRFVKGEEESATEKALGSDVCHYVVLFRVRSNCKEHRFCGVGGKWSQRQSICWRYCGIVDARPFSE